MDSWAFITTLSCRIDLLPGIYTVCGMLTGISSAIDIVAQAFSGHQGANLENIHSKVYLLPTHRGRSRFEGRKNGGILFL